VAGPASSWWGRRGPWERLALVATVVVVGASLIVLIGEARTPATSPTVSSAQARAFRLEAFGACKGFVKNKLPEPATATFPDGNVQVVKGSSTSEWIVRGPVESQSGFGLSLRQRFVCTMLTTSTGGWAAESVTLSS